MEILNILIHSVPFVVGIALVAITLGGKAPLLTGIALIILGLLLK
jgi:hypothetical protein